MSTQPKHTPGPWSIGRSEWDGWHHTAPITAPNGEHVADGHNHADSLLIAAAPDMLETLETCIEVWDFHARTGDADTSDLYRWVKEAIDKARGEIA